MDSCHFTPVLCDVDIAAAVDVNRVAGTRGCSAVAGTRGCSAVAGKPTRKTDSVRDPNPKPTMNRFKARLQSRKNKEDGITSKIQARNYRLNGVDSTLPVGCKDDTPPEPGVPASADACCVSHKHAMQRPRSWQRSVRCIQPPWSIENVFAAVYSAGRSTGCIALEKTIRS